MSDGSREQLFLVHLTVDGTDLGVWDSWQGADKGTSSVKYRSGGEPDEEDLGGGSTYSDLTIGRNYRLSRDAPIIGFLLNKCSIGSVVATKQPLDRSLNTYGNPVIARGVLLGVNDAKADSNANNAAMVTVTIGVNSLVAT